MIDELDLRGEGRSSLFEKSDEANDVLDRDAEPQARRATDLRSGSIQAASSDIVT